MRVIKLVRYNHDFVYNYDPENVEYFFPWRSKIIVLKQ